MKHPREKTCIHEIFTRKKLDVQNTHEKKFWTHEKPARKIFESTKYPRQKILDPRNIHEKKIWTISLCLDP